jgi:hypothetical protein
MISLDNEGGGRRQPWWDKNEEGVRHFIALLSSISASWMENEEIEERPQGERLVIDDNLISGSPRDRLSSFVACKDSIGGVVHGGNDRGSTLRLIP